MFAVVFVVLFVTGEKSATEQMLQVAADETPTEQGLQATSPVAMVTPEPTELPALAPLPVVEEQNSAAVELGKWLFFDNRISS